MLKILLNAKWKNPAYPNYEFKIVSIEVPRNILHHTGYVNNKPVVGWNICLDDFYRMFTLITDDTDAE